MEIENETIVVKVGSSSVADHNTGIFSDKLDVYAAHLVDLQQVCGRVAVVTSGAAYTGEAYWKSVLHKTKALSAQEYAGIGAARVAVAWQEALGRYGVAGIFAQPTHHEIDDRVEGRMLISALEASLDNGIIPIINANDMLSTDELIKDGWGDNDGLAAHISTVIGADRLIMLTDVRGLLRCGKYLVRHVASQADHSSGIYSYNEALEIAGFIDGKETENSMASKMKALYDTSQRGITGHIAQAGDNLFDVVNGKKGTTVEAIMG